MALSQPKPLVEPKQPSPAPIPIPPLPSEPPAHNFSAPIILDVTKQFHCIRCGTIQPNESACEITLGNPMKMSIQRYRPICTGCLGQLQDKVKPKPQQP